MNIRYDPFLSQFGFSFELYALLIAYFIVWSPLGFLGCFFAIPLATLINAILRSWPRTEVEVSATA